jgi:hypothetical protein
MNDNLEKILPYAIMDIHPMGSFTHAMNCGTPLEHYTTAFGVMIRRNHS